jgi:diguanylate cyclase (GGDEF)-like protein
MAMTPRHDADPRWQALRGVGRSVAEVHGLLLLLTLFYYVVARDGIANPTGWLLVLVGYGIVTLVCRGLRSLEARPRFRLGVEAVLMVVFLTGLLALTTGGPGPVVHLYLLPVVLTALVLGRGPTVALLALVLAGRVAVGFASEGSAWLAPATLVALFTELSPTLLVAFLTSAMATDLGTVTVKLRALEERDALTGLLNLNAFSTQLAAAHRRLGPGDSYAVLLVDVDDLKDINHRFGHEAGDRALRAVADAIRRATRAADDGCARFASDEFVVYLPGGTRESAGLIANRIHHHVYSVTQDFDYAMRRLAVSVGVAVHGEDGSDPRVLLQAAARAVLRDRELRGLRERQLPGAAVAPGRPA